MKWKSGLGGGVGALALLTLVPAFAGEPTAREPLLAPLFTIDEASPEVVGGLLEAGDLLTPAAAFPAVVFPFSGLGLLEADDVDALAGFEPTLTFGDPFSLIFSVTRSAVGAVPPDPTLVAQGFFYNVQDQALKNQEAGDAYMSLLLFTRNGPIPPGLPSMRGPSGSLSPNNSLVINHGDAGGVDFAVNPPTTSPDTTLFTPPELGNVDGGSGTLPSAPGPTPRGFPPGTLLFSLTSASPSTFSGAAIFADPDATVGGNEYLYTSPVDLGLVNDDDISSLIVFEDGDFIFDPGADQILFTLAAGSPSLIGRGGPGDIFVSFGLGMFNLYAHAETLGLFQSDSIDMLDLVPCTDALTCAQDWAIGDLCPGDLNGDQVVDLMDLSMLLTNFGQSGGPGQGDLDRDGFIDLADLSILLVGFGQPCL